MKKLFFLISILLGISTSVLSIHAADIAIVDYADQFDNEACLGPLLDDLEWNYDDITALVEGGSFALGEYKVFIIGSFVTNNPTLHGSLDDNAEELRAFVANGGWIIELTQADQNQASIDWLPAGLSASRGDADYSQIVILDEDHYIFSHPNALSEEDLSGWGLSSGGWSSAWETFGAHSGFTVLAASDAGGSNPCILEGMYGSGAIMLLSMALDKMHVLGTTQKTRENSLRLMENILTEPLVNKLPVASDPQIIPETPDTEDDLQAYYVYSDPDDNSESGSEIRWYRNGFRVSGLDDMKLVPSSGTSVGDEWYFTVRPSDGIDYGEIQESPKVTIQPAIAVVIYVSTDGDDDSGDGSYANPYLTIQKGIDMAADGSDVLVGDGIYAGAGNVNLDFKGKAITVASENGPENCIIDCQDEENVRGFVFQKGEGSDSVLEGFKIRNGNADMGGGIYCKDSAPTIKNNIIMSNSADYGGGIYCRGAGSDPVIDSNIIMGNSADRGGGIYCWGANPAIVNNLIRLNSADTDEGGQAFGYGGGICINSSTNVVVYNTITENSADRGGGVAIYGDCKLGIYNTIIWNNRLGGSTTEIYLIDAGTEVSVAYSDVQGGAAGVEGQGSVDDWDSNIDIDPLFVGNGDYHLSNYSRCIGAGAVTPILIDIEGNPRPDPGGSDPDIGAYENNLSTPLNRLPSANNLRITPVAPDTGDNLQAYYVYSDPDDDNESGSEIKWYKTGQTGELFSGNPLPSSSTAEGDEWYCTVRPSDGIGFGDIQESAKVTILSETIYVSTTGDDDNGDGSYGNPYRTIQKGINAPGNGFTVVVMDGAYSGPGNVNLDFGGKAITVKSLNGPENCIIDCANATNSRGFYFHSEEGTDSVVEGFTIRKATASGIYCSNSSPTIKNNVLLGNSGARGGGIACADSELIIMGNIIRQNRASESGGGIYFYGPGKKPKITGNTITGNSADIGGGGILCSSGYPMIANNIIAGNWADQGDGGGVYCHYNFPTIINNTITGNAANSGGGVYSIGGAATVVNTIIWGNSPDGIPGGASITYSDIQGGFVGEGNIDADPLFADADNGDYHLSRYSPCLAAGTTNENVPATDIEGNQRPTPTGSMPDMGAYDLSIPRVIYVDKVSTAGPWYGTLAFPYQYIQEGIDEAMDGDTVQVADGTYTGEKNVNLDFGGKAITVKSENGPYSCIIDCQYTSVVRGFIFQSGEGFSSVVDGFTIRNGSLDKFPDDGAGICCDNSSSPIIRNNIITQNRTIFGLGGGIYCGAKCSPKITNNIISENYAYNTAGIYCGQNSTAEIRNNVIIDNDSEMGSGIYCSSSSPMIVNNIIMDNAIVYTLEPSDPSEGGSGGIYCNNSAPDIISNVISGNSVNIPDMSDVAGGIYCRSSSPNIFNNTIVNNANDEGDAGGICCDAASSPTITNTIVWDNTPSNIVGSAVVNYSNIQGGWSGIGNRNTDPLFLSSPDGEDSDGDGEVDEPDELYRLSLYSRCIGAGTAIGAPGEDIEGTTRPNPNGSMPDIGAYEHELGTPMNRVPMATNLRISPGTPDSSVPLTAVYDFADLDGDSESGSEIKWYKVGDDQEQFSGDPLPSDHTAAGDEWYFKVRPSDGIGFGVAQESSAIEILPQVIYVAKNGDDQNGNGEYDNPYLTIGKAIEMAEDGAFVSVGDGDYDEYLEFGDWDSSYDESITIKSQNGPRNCSINGATIYGAEDALIRLDGFELRQNGITIACGSTIIANNVIRNSDYGIYIENGVNTTIANNVIVSNYNGISMYNFCSDSPSSSVNIVNNTIASNIAGVYYHEEGDLHYQPCNTFNINIVNSILWNEGSEISIGSTYPEGDAAVDLEVTYSCVKGGYPGAGNIGDDPSDDPSFENPSIGDYRLSRRSPCRETGTTHPNMPNTDIEGHPRPDPPPNPDMGAYEMGPIAEIEIGDILILAEAANAEYHSDGSVTFYSPVDIGAHLTMLDGYIEASNCGDTDGDGIPNCESVQGNGRLLLYTQRGIKELLQGGFVIGPASETSGASSYTLEGNGYELRSQGDWECLLDDIGGFDLEDGGGSLIVDLVDGEATFHYGLALNLPGAAGDNVINSAYTIYNNGFEGGGLAEESKTFTITIAGIDFNIDTENIEGEVEITEDGIHIERAGIELPETLGGLQAEVEGINIFGHAPYMTFDMGRIEIPEIKIGGGPEGEFKIAAFLEIGTIGQEKAKELGVTAGELYFTGAGKFELPAPKLTVDVNVTIVSESPYFQEASLYIHTDGPGIPLGTTGAFLTGGGASLWQRNNFAQWRVTGQVDMGFGAYVPKRGYPANGTAALTIAKQQSGTLVDFDGQFTMYDIVKLNGKITFHTAGYFHGSLAMDINLYIFRADGIVELNIWKEAGEMHFNGMIRARVYVPKGIIWSGCVDFGFFDICIYIPPFSITLSQIELLLGELLRYGQTVHGVKAAVSYLGIGIAVFVNLENGDVEWGSNLSHIRLKEPVFPGDTVPSQALGKLAGASMIDTEGWTVESGTEALIVIAHWEQKTSARPTFSLIDPDGNRVTYETADVTLKQNGEAIYMVEPDGSKVILPPEDLVTEEDEQSSIAGIEESNSIYVSTSTREQTPHNGSSISGEEQMQYADTYIIKSPIPGTWKYEFVGEDLVNWYYIDKADSVTPPSIDLTEPSSEGETGDPSYTIQWSMENVNKDSQVSLYYDQDNEGLNGQLIVAGLDAEQVVSYVWDTSSAPSDPVNGTEYYIYAVIDDGSNKPDSSYSTGTVLVLNNTPPASPTGVSVTPANGALVMEWAPNGESDLAGYKVHYRAPGETDWVITSAAMATVYKLGNLTNGWEYDVKVEAVDTSGNESANGTVHKGTPSDTVEDLPPMPPTELMAQINQDGDRSIALSWAPSADTDIVAYRIYYGYSEALPYIGGTIDVDIGDITGGASYEISGLTPGIRYYFVLTAIDGMRNESSFSLPASVNFIDDTDSDGDGLPDEWENLHFDNLNAVSSIDGDYDKDGLSNGDEYQRGTSPARRDTDSDRVPDGDDPNPNDKLDNDRDLMADDWETFHNVSDPQGDEDMDMANNLAEYIWDTNPRKIDTDGDGISDFAEIQAGSDPNDFREVPMQQEITLHEGWNLFSTGMELGVSDIEAVLAPIKGDYICLWTCEYDEGTDTQKWRCYYPGIEIPEFDALNSIEAGKGYWICMTRPNMLTISGERPAEDPIELFAGWNMVGFNSLEDQPCPGALSSIEGMCKAVYAYDTVNEKWQAYSPDKPDFLDAVVGDLTELKCGKGFLIMVTNGCTWDVKGDTSDLTE